MNQTVCRNCGVDFQGGHCPKCGAPQLGIAAPAPAGFEWRSDFLWLGRPFVHVAFGMDEKTGRPRIACGVIAIGQRAVGGIAIGIMAVGFIAIGLVAFGIFAGGVVAIAVAAALGINAAAPLAIGVVAAGWKAGGVAAIGKKILFSAVP